LLVCFWNSCFVIGIAEPHQAAGKICCETYSHIIIGNKFLTTSLPVLLVNKMKPFYYQHAVVSPMYVLLTARCAIYYNRGCNKI